MAMNLHNIIKSSINILNPCQKIKLHKFKKEKVDEYGKVKNSYDIYEVEARIQPVNSFKLQHINNFNSSNAYKKLFLNGFQNALSEALNTNGDLFEIDGKIWLIVEAPQVWAYTGWNELTICLQTDEVDNGRYI